MTPKEWKQCSLLLLGVGWGREKQPEWIIGWWLQHIRTIDFACNFTYDSHQLIMGTIKTVSCIHSHFRISLWKHSFGNCHFAQSFAYQFEAAKIIRRSIRQQSPKQQDRNIELLLGQFHFKGISIGRDFSPHAIAIILTESDKVSGQKDAYLEMKFSKTGISGIPNYPNLKWI